MSATCARTWGRSAAVDFFRGLGLWIILIDHIEPNIWSHLTLWRYGFSDFAEIFVFLSGFMGPGSYERALAAGNTSAVVRKLGGRMLRLYAAHLASLAVSLFLLAACAHHGLRLSDPDLYVWMQDPPKYFFRVLALTYAPHLFALLPLYILTSPLLLLAIAGLRRSPKLTLAISGGLWLASQFPAFGPGLMPAGKGYFSPLAWQFLFVLGAAVRSYESPLKSITQSPWVVRFAAAICGAAVALKSLTLFPWALHRMSEQLHSLVWRNSGKAQLAPYRLVHFAALLIVFYALTHDRRRWLQSPVARLAISGGRDSLFLYACTLVMATAASLIIAKTHGGAIVQTELTVTCLGLLASLTWLRRGGVQISLARIVPGQIRSSME